MYNSNSSPTLNDCTFTNNSAGEDGGGIHNYYGSSPTLTNCTLTENSAESSGGGMHSFYNCNPTLSQTVACGNAPDQISGGWTDNGGNTVSDNCISDCFFDFNGDGVVDGDELTYVLGAWGTDDPVADVTEDGIVDGADLNVILGAWGACP